MSSFLDDVLTRFGALPEAEKKSLAKEAHDATREMLWVPNPGPQLMALESEADETYLGGAAGGGKSSFLVGLALTVHHRSIIFRREFPQIRGLEDEAQRILGSRDGYNGQEKLWRLPGGRILEFGSCQHESDVGKYQGRPHDLVSFDELPQFSESQYRFLIGWNRSTKPGQRCRVVGAGNPPLTPEELWVVKYWGPWLDPNHPRPARPGELRWYTTIDGQDQECDGPDPVMVKGALVKPRSRTFIPAKLEDNPDLMRTGYASVLEAMPEELRVRLREGKFTSEFRDDEFQVIPTPWIEAAQARWTPRPPEGARMTAMGVDVAQGGIDQTILAPRYGDYFAPMIVRPGKDTPDGPSVAGLIIIHQRDGAQVNIDLGGGWGGSAYDHLKSNEGLSVLGINPASGTSARTMDGKLTLTNKRAELWWGFREALAPDSPHKVALPPDAELKADLAAPRWHLTPGGIQIELKKHIKQRIGRSPDKGDAVTLAWHSGSRRVRPLQSAAMPSMSNGRGPQDRGHSLSRSRRMDKRTNQGESSGDEHG